MLKDIYSLHRKMIYHEIKCINIQIYVDLHKKLCTQLSDSNWNSLHLKNMLCYMMLYVVMIHVILIMAAAICSDDTRDIEHG